MNKKNGDSRGHPGTEGNNVLRETGGKGIGDKLKTESSAKAAAGEKLLPEKTAETAAGEKLRFDKAVFGPEEPMSKGKKLVREKQYEKNRYGRKTPAAKKAKAAASAELHAEIAKDNEDGNVAVDAANRGSQAAEIAADKGSNALSRFFQKKAIKQEYAAMKMGRTTGSAAGRAAAAGNAVGSAGAGTSAAGNAAGEAASAAAKGTSVLLGGTVDITEKIFGMISANSHALIAAGAMLLVVVFVSGTMSSCSAVFQGVINGVVGSSYTGEDTALTATEKSFLGMEGALKKKLDNPADYWPDYDGYVVEEYSIDHNPYELAAYAQVLRMDGYSEEQINEAVKALFEKQYTLETWVVEIDHEDDPTEYIFHARLTNHGLGSVIDEAGMTDEQKEHYSVLLETYGNHPELFTDEFFSLGAAEGLHYDIPGEALSDERFARMITEAEKYLGTPYVWGGYSPTGGFDCSGFVSYVVNHCGNGWSYGRLTAEGLRQVCDIIPKSEAKPGDLIFFKGTYNTSGASHVGIYVGDGMMIHCGHPVQYKSCETDYWKQHFFCIGRLP